MLAWGLYVTEVNSSIIVAVTFSNSVSSGSVPAEEHEDIGTGLSLSLHLAQIRDWNFLHADYL